MFLIPTAEEIISKIDGNTATSEEKAPSSWIISCFKLAKKFLKKNWDPELLGPNIGNICAYYYSTSSRLA